MAFSDKMVLLDETFLARGFTFVTRNRIKGPEGEHWISVPLKRKGRGRQQINNLEICEKEKWAKDFLLTLRHFYGKSVYFEPVFERIHRAVAREDNSFLNMVWDLLVVMRDSFGIDGEMILQSETGITEKGTPLLVSIAKELGADEIVLPYFSEKAIECERFTGEGIRIRFLRYAPPPYPQFWGPYLINLSALDLLLCMGKNGKSIITKGTYLYEYELQG